VWSKDGTRYDFTQPLWTDDTQERFVYKWLLTQVSDTHGNKIVYAYQVDPVNQGNTYNPTAYLQTITWGFDGAIPGTGNRRYRVSLVANDRQTGQTAGVDGNWEYPVVGPPNPDYWKPVVPHEKYRLDQIKVESWPPNQPTYQLVRQYNLNYAATAASLQIDDY